MTITILNISKNWASMPYISSINVNICNIDTKANQTKIKHISCHYILVVLKVKTFQIILKAQEKPEPICQ